MVRLFLTRSCLSFLLSLLVSFQIGVAAAAQITVSWRDNSTNEDGFKVERKKGLLGAYAFIKTANANVTSILDTGLTAGVLYCYRVYAYNSVGKSAYSNEACGLPDVLAPKVSITTPVAGATVVGTVTVKAAASDVLGVAGVQFRLDGINLGKEVTTAPYSISWDTTTTFDGSHTLTALARNTVGQKTLSADVAVTVSNRQLKIPGLTLAYSFSEGAGTTVKDLSGNDRDGTVAGAIWTVGKYGNALSFNGGAAKVISGLRTHATARSYLVWTKRTGPGGGSFGRIFDKRTNGAEVELLFNDEAAKAYRYVRLWSGGVGSWKIPQPSANVWHHIAVVYDASSAANSPRIYVDGVARIVTRVKTPKGTPLANTDPYIVGNRGAGDRGWSGVLDSVRIYYVALTASQIRTAMTSAIAVPTADTSSSSASIIYNFNEGTGTTVADLSGNNRPGTVAGATWTVGKYDNALSFNGGGAKVISGLSTHATMRTYLVWTKRTGPGGGNAGRIFEKRTNGAEVERLYNDSVAKVYSYERVWSGRFGVWTIPQPSANVWHHIAVVYDASSAANSPRIYVDGVAQVVTRVKTPRGTPLTNDDPYVIGNRGAGDRGWSGVLDDVRIYYAALTAAQIQTAMAGAVSAPAAAPASQNSTESELASSTSTAAPSSAESELASSTSTTALPTTDFPTDATATASTAPVAATLTYHFDEGTGTIVTDASGNNWDGVVESASWTPAGKYDNALFFDGGAAKVTSRLNIHATVRSYLLWTNRSSARGGSCGRIFDKRTNGHEIELLCNDEGSGVYRYVRAWSGGVGSWTIPQPSANVWHHIAVVYDASSEANAPQIYVDGVSQIVNQETAPRGTPLANTDPYVFGNRGTGDQGWSGMLDEVQIYDAALTAAQIQAAMTTAGSVP